jgi:hypothetical protein
MDLPEGSSFDYPAGWTVYYPHEVTTVGYAVVTVASVPVGPPCADDWCQRFTTPPGTVAIEFWVGSSPVPPRWSDARLTVGGQPAFRQDWGSPNNATGADEGHTWTVRLNDPSTLDISVSLRGPDLPGLRAAVDEVLGSVRITQLPSSAVASLALVVEAPGGIWLGTDCITHRLRHLARPALTVPRS